PSSCNTPPTTDIYTLSLHDALPIYHRAGEPGGELPLSIPGDRQQRRPGAPLAGAARENGQGRGVQELTAPLAGPVLGMRAYLRRSEEHTSELQSLTNIVCRLLLETK